MSDVQTMTQKSEATRSHTAGASADALVVGGRTFGSRLMVGTGKYRDFGVMREAIAASGAEIVTVSIRRVELGAAGHAGLLDLPNPVETLHAAERLVGEGFTVLPYMPADPVLARRLEAAGCATVMPLASPTGSGRGVRTRSSLEIIVEQATVPVVVDAGLGVPSEAAEVMEIGAHASPSSPTAGVVRLPDPEVPA